jgi:hypothetical protein
MTARRITTTMTTITHTYHSKKAKAEKQEGLANSKVTSPQPYRHRMAGELQLVAKYCIAKNPVGDVYVYVNVYGRRSNSWSCS